MARKSSNPWEAGVCENSSNLSAHNSAQDVHGSVKSRINMAADRVTESSDCNVTIHENDVTTKDISTSSNDCNVIRLFTDFSSLKLSVGKLGPYLVSGLLENFLQGNIEYLPLTIV